MMDVQSGSGLVPHDLPLGDAVDFLRLIRAGAVHRTLRATARRDLDGTRVVLGTLARELDGAGRPSL